MRLILDEQALFTCCCYKTYLNSTSNSVVQICQNNHFWYFKKYHGIGTRAAKQTTIDQLQSYSRGRVVKAMESRTDFYFGFAQRMCFCYQAVNKSARILPLNLPQEYGDLKHGNALHFEVLI